MKQSSIILPVDASGSIQLRPHPDLQHFSVPEHDASFKHCTTQGFVRVVELSGGQTPGFVVGKHLILVQTTCPFKQLHLLQSSVKLSPI